MPGKHKCQICGMTLTIKDGKPYAEAHHIKPLGNPHNGPDVRGNILCVCPNHHVLLDYGAIKLDIKKLEGVKKIYIDYHKEDLQALLGEQSRYFWTQCLLPLFRCS